MNDLKFAFRQLLKNPGFTAVAVLTLALGIGANTALFSVVNGVLLRPLPFHEQDRLVTLWESNPARGVEQQNVSPPAGWNGLPRDRRGGNWLSVLARLKPGVTLAQAQAELNTIQARLAQEHSCGAMAPGVAVVPLLQQTVGRNTRTALLVLWGVV